MGLQLRIGKLLGLLKQVIQPLALPGDLDQTHGTGAKNVVASPSRVRTRSPLAVPRPQASRKLWSLSKASYASLNAWMFVTGPFSSRLEVPTITESNTAALSARTGRKARFPIDSRSRSMV